MLCAPFYKLIIPLFSPQDPIRLFFRPYASVVRQDEPGYVSHLRTYDVWLCWERNIDIETRKKIATSERQFLWRNRISLKLLLTGPGKIHSK